MPRAIELAEEWLASESGQQALKAWQAKRGFDYSEEEFYSWIEDSPDFKYWCLLKYAGHPMRAEDEIRMAHDLIVSIVSREVNPGFSPDEMIWFQKQADVLCWVLSHPVGNFDVVLGRVRRLLRMAGRRVQ